VSLEVFELLAACENFSVRSFSLISICNHFAISDMYHRRRHCSVCKHDVQDKKWPKKQKKM